MWAYHFRLWERGQRKEDTLNRHESSLKYTFSTNGTFYCLECTFYCSSGHLLLSRVAPSIVSSGTFYVSSGTFYCLEWHLLIVSSGTFYVLEWPFYCSRVAPLLSRVATLSLARVLCLPLCNDLSLLSRCVEVAGQGQGHDACGR